MASVCFQLSMHVQYFIYQLLPAELRNSERDRLNRHEIVKLHGRLHIMKPCETRYLWNGSQKMTIHVIKRNLFKDGCFCYFLFLEIAILYLV